MPIPRGHQQSSYTKGEMIALIAPIMGCDPEEISELVIVAYAADGETIGVHPTMMCQIKEHWQTKTIVMLGEAIEMLANAIHDQSTQHGPGE